MAEEATHMAGPKPAHGTFCWTEIASSDLEQSRSFFSNVFGWQIKDGDAETGGFKYLEFSSSGGDNPDGGMYEINPEWFGGNPPPPHLMVYIAVDDVDAAAKKASEIGGTIKKEPMDIPNVGRMAIVADPAGAVFSLFTPKL